MTPMGYERPHALTLNAAQGRETNRTRDQAFGWTSQQRPVVAFAGRP
jgi:hypothetical protein